MIFVHIRELNPLNHSEFLFAYIVVFFVLLYVNKFCPPLPNNQKRFKSLKSSASARSKRLQYSHEMHLHSWWTQRMNEHKKNTQRRWKQNDAKRKIIRVTNGKLCMRRRWMSELARMFARTLTISPSLSGSRSTRELLLPLNVRHTKPSIHNKQSKNNAHKSNKSTTE